MIDEHKNRRYQGLILALPGQTLLEMWQGVIKDDDDVSKEEKFASFLDFFAYAIAHNHIVECSDSDLRPIFSGEEPIVVSRRILSDFPIDEIPISSEKMREDFLVYMVTKMRGWAVLVNGTTLAYPE